MRRTPQFFDGLECVGKDDWARTYDALQLISVVHVQQKVTNVSVSLVKSDSLAIVSCGTIRQ